MNFKSSLKKMFSAAVAGKAAKYFSILLVFSAMATVSVAQAPANDNACQAIQLTPAATCTYQVFTNLNATGSTGMATPACATYSGGDVWFKATVPAGGALTFDTQEGTMTDGGMAIYRGGTCVALVLLPGACDDNSSANPNMPKVTVTGLNPGSTVYARVWSKNNVGNGTFGICVTIPAPAPANDEPCTATELTPTANCAYQTFTTESATNTASPIGPVCAGFLGGDVWFKVVVPAIGALVFDTQEGTMIDGGMAVYSGSSCTGLLAFLDCDDNSSSNSDMPKLTVGSLTPGDTVWVRVWAAGNVNTGTFGICVTLPPPPPANDGPCNAIELTVGTSCTYQTFTNQDATGTAGAPAPGCADYQGGDVWFKAVVPAGGAISFDTEDDDLFDGGMAVYGGNCSNLILLNCDDDGSGNGNMPKLTIGGLTAGDTVWVRFWDAGNDDFGNFGICATIPPPPPANDEPCNAIELIPDPVCTFQTFTNENATGTPLVGDPGCASYQGGDVWFKVVVPSGGALTFNTQTDVITDGGMAIYSGTCGNLTLIECDDDDSPNGNMPLITAGGLTPGDTIWVRMWEFQGDNNGQFGICVTIPPPPPANDNPCDAIVLVADVNCNYQTFTNESSFGTTGVPAPGCAGYNGGDVWFKAVVPAGGGIIFDTDEGVMTDGGMAVYSGNCNNLTLISCDDNTSANGAMPRITVVGLTPGDTLWVRVWENGNDENGTFGICATLPPPAPVNDDPCAAIELVAASTCTFQTFTNESALGTTGVTAPGCANYQGGDVWFKAVVPAGGAIRFDTEEGVMDDGGMAVYSGNCTGLTLISCDDNSSTNGLMPKLTLTGLTVGDTLWIRVWENGNNNNGSFGICATIPPPPPVNDNPCNATPLIPDSTCTFQTFSNENATDSPGIPAPGCASYQGADVWFSVVVPSGGALIFDSQEGDITDGGMAIYKGTCNNLTLLDCNDDGSTNGAMSLITAGGLTPGDTIWVRMWEFGGSDPGGTFGICVKLPPPGPVNDDPCDAIELIPSATCTYQNFTNESSFGSAGVPAPGCGGYAGGDVWFKVIVPAGGALSFDTQTGTMTDGAMAIYKGTCGNLTLLDCDADGSTNGFMPAIIAGGLIPGDTVYVRVWEEGNNNNGTFGICVTVPPPGPGNDDPCNAFILTPSATCNYQTFTNAGAINTVGIPDPGCANYQGGDVWFQVVVPAQGGVIVDTREGTMTDGGMALYTGTCTNLQLVSCDDNNSVNGNMPTIYATGLVPGTIAWIRVWENGNDNNGTFDICITIPPPQPPTISFNCVKDTTINCDNCFGLTAIIPNIHSSTATYVVNPISGPGNCFRPYVGPEDVGPSANLGTDDVYTGVINLPFTFPFYGTDYNGLVASTNGYLSFDVAEEGAFSHYSILNNNGGLSSTAGTGQNLPSALYDRALIMGPYHDIDPGEATSPTMQIKYNITGIAPNRRWILSFNKVPLYSNPATTCNVLFNNTHQIVLYEGTGVVEVFVFGKEICPIWNDGRAMIGMQDFNRTNAIMAPNRRASDPRWGTPNMNESWRFTPTSGPTLFKRVELYDTSGTLISVGDTSSIDIANLKVNFNNICPRIQTVGVTTFIVKTVYTQFNNPAGETTSTDTIRVTRNAALNANYDITNASCNQTDGSIVITPVGTAPYTYSSNGGTNYQPDSSFINLAPGTYNLVVKDANNCTRDTIVVIKAQSPVIPTYDTTQATCNGGNGGILVHAVGTTGPYQFSADGGTTYQLDSSFTLPAGTYNVVIKDTNNCVKDTTIIITEPAVIAPTPVVTDVLCIGASNGIIAVSQSGGTGSFTYSIDGGVTYQVSDTFTVAAGTYTIRFKDANGCTKDTTVTVGQPDSLFTSSVITPVSCTNATGTISTTAVGGTGGYTYSIDGGVTFQPAGNFTNLVAGAYTIRVRDANGCTKDTTVQVTSVIVVLATPSVVIQPTCNGGNNGSIVFNPLGGAIPYTFSNDGGVTYQPSASYTNLAAGTYTFTVKDANGCTKDTIIQITAPPVISSTATITQVACNAGTTGSIDITGSGGAGIPFTYSIDAGVTYQPTGSFANLAAGAYSIRIKDVNGCTKDTSFTVTEPTAILTNSVITAVTCTGNNGIIDISAVGGTGTYTYSIDAGVTYQPTGSFSSLASGSYTIKVKDANGCTKDTTVIVGASVITIVTPAVVTAVSCNSGTTGSIVFSPAGGATPYTFSSDAGLTYQPSGTYSNLAAGTYTYRIKDANGCTKDTTIQVTEPAAVSATAVITAASCNGVADGTVVVAGTGGTIPYQYSSDGGANYQNSGSFTVAAGAVTIRIKDANGCTKDTSFTVTQPAAIVATATTADANCTNAVNGQITVAATGGTGTLSYSIDAVNFQGGTTFTTAQGTYTVTVKDANGCSVATPAIVGFTFDLTLQGRLDTVICDNGRVRLNTVSNAASYSWTPASSLDNATVASPFASPTVTTDYIVTVTLGTNCTLKDTVRVVVTAAPTVFAGNDIEVIKGGDAALSATATNYATFSWSPTTYLNNPNSLKPISVMPQETTTYTLTVANAEGCMRSDDVKVIVLPYCIKVKNAFTPNGDGVNDTWMVYDQYDCLTNVKVQVFNRYGSKVFESSNYRNEWKGTFGGQSLPDATYYYVIDFSLTGGRALQLRGDVTILR